MSTFVPQFSFIASIAQGQQTVVTFTANCDFIAGEIVSFRVSPASGMKELNNQQTTVSKATSNTITVPINSTNYTPFVFINPTIEPRPAMVVPVGSGIVKGAMPPQTQLQDAFDNVPFN